MRNRALSTKILKGKTDRMATQKKFDSMETLVAELTERGGQEELVKALAEMHFPEDSGVARHDGRSILLPHDMGLDRAQKVLQGVREDMEQPTSSTHTFDYALDDCLVALDWAIRQMFGAALQRGIPGFFGVRPPETRPVVVGLDSEGKEIIQQVPEGRIALPGLYESSRDGDIGLIQTGYDKKNGFIVGQIGAYVRKRHQPVILELVKLVKQRLRTHSIYKGQIVSPNLKFIHFGDFDRDQLVLAEKVRYGIENLIMLPITNPDLSDQMGAEPRRAAIFIGDYGTGKSLALREIAVRAKESGWTVIVSNDGDTNLDKLIGIARQYQPAVIQLEDVDFQVSGGRDAGMNGILNALDGIVSKNSRVFAMMTTNHPDRIHESVLRPGRTSVILKFGGLDATGFERLIGQCGLKFDAKIDWEMIAERYSELMPCYVKEASIRLGFAHSGNGSVLVSENEVVNVLEGLLDHLRLQQAATKGTKTTRLEDLHDGLIKKRVQEAVEDIKEYL